MLLRPARLSLHPFQVERRSRAFPIYWALIGCGLATPSSAFTFLGRASCDSPTWYRRFASYQARRPSKYLSFDSPSEYCTHSLAFFLVDTTSLCTRTRPVSVISLLLLLLYRLMLKRLLSHFQYLFPLHFNLLWSPFNLLLPIPVIFQTAYSQLP